MPKSISISSSSSSRSKPDGDKPSKTFDFDNDEYTDDGADALFGEEESDEDMLSKALMGDSVCICQRCFRLQQYGQVEENLRPGWSDHELLTPERFEDLLTGRYQEWLSMSLISTLTHITNIYRSLPTAYHWPLSPSHLIRIYLARYQRDQCRSPLHRRCFRSKRIITRQFTTNRWEKPDRHCSK